MAFTDLDSLLRRALGDGIVTADQAERLRTLAAEDGASPSRGGEAPRGFNAVNVAYGIGALLVLFAFAWFLFDRWGRLGAWGVLAVVAVYASILVAMAAWLRRRGFPGAASVAIMLAVSLTPLATWALLSLAGRWPEGGLANRWQSYAPWMAWQWLVVELSTILVALLVLRWRRLVSLTHPIAVALWGLHYHLGQLVRGEWGSLAYERWMLMANALMILVVADFVERWQERTAPGEGPRGREHGDFASAFWLVGLIAFAFAYADLWERAGDWRHLLPVIALGFVAMSLYLRRRVILAFGVLGVFVYVAWLTDSVFRDIVSFPIVIAALGILTIAATVWTQRRFPSLVARIDASRGGRGRALPWSPILSLMAPIFALVVALAELADSADERAQREFQQRLWILREHSHRYEKTRNTRNTRGPASGGT